MVSPKLGTVYNKMIVYGEVFLWFQEQENLFKDYIFPLNYQQKKIGLHTYDTDS